MVLYANKLLDAQIIHAPAHHALLEGSAKMVRITQMYCGACCNENVKRCTRITQIKTFIHLYPSLCDITLLTFVDCSREP